MYDHYVTDFLLRSSYKVGLPWHKWVECHYLIVMGHCLSNVQKLQTAQCIFYLKSMENRWLLKGILATTTAQPTMYLDYGVVYCISHICLLYKTCLDC